MPPRCGRAASGLHYSFEINALGIDDRYLTVDLADAMGATVTASSPIVDEPSRPIIDDLFDVVPARTDQFEWCLRARALRPARVTHGVRRSVCLL